MTTISWQPTTLVQCVSTRPWLAYPGCDEPGGCHDLTLGKIYEMIGVEGKGSFYRIVDDSGEDYLVSGVALSSGVTRVSVIRWSAQRPEDLDSSARTASNHEQSSARCAASG